MSVRPKRFPKMITNIENDLVFSLCRLSFFGHNIFLSFALLTDKHQKIQVQEVVGSNPTMKTNIENDLVFSPM